VHPHGKNEIHDRVKQKDQQHSGAENAADGVGYKPAGGWCYPLGHTPAKQTGQQRKHKKARTQPGRTRTIRYRGQKG